VKVMPPEEFMFMNRYAPMTTARTMPPIASIRGVTLMPAIVATGAPGVPGGVW
jgi:hypothetical protein